MQNIVWNASLSNFIFIFIIFILTSLGVDKSDYISYFPPVLLLAPLIGSGITWAFADDPYNKGKNILDPAYYK